MLISIDLARMYTLVSRLAEDRGRDELQGRFEGHVHMQGVAAVEKCGESAQNVCVGGGGGGGGGGVWVGVCVWGCVGVWVRGWVGALVCMRVCVCYLSVPPLSLSNV